MILSDSSMSPSIFQRSLLADGVFAAGLSASATGEASLLADFIGREYRTGNDSSVSTSGDLITHSRSGNAVMTDGYGPELVVNGDFSSGDLTGWTDNSTGSGSVSVVNNTLLLAGTDTSNRGFVTSDSFTTKPNVAYVIELSVTDRQGSGDLQLQFSDVGGNRLDEFPITAKGRYQYTVIAQRTESYLKINCYDDDSVSIDNVSVREMPVLKWAPHNLALYSEQFDNAVWAKVRTTVTANQTTAPDGTTTADKIIETAETGNHFIVDSSSVSFSVGQIGTSAVFLKAGERSAAVMQITDPSSPSRTRLQAIVDLSAGTITTQEFNSPTNIKSSITDAGNGWYLVKLSMATKAAGPMECLFGPLDSTSYTTNLPAYTGDGSSGIYAWGAHIFRSDLGGMADNPDRGDSYVPTALRPTGANLVTNGTFDTDTTGWTGVNGAALSVSNGALVVTSNGTAIRPQANQTITGLTVGKAYELTALAKSGVNNFPVEIEIAGISGVYEHSSTSFQRITRSFVATSTSHVIQAKFESGSIPTAGSTVEFDNISVRESTVRPDTARYLPRIGHHVYNGSAWVNEGLLAESEARTNVATYSNFSSGFGTTRCTRTPDAAVSPDGTQNASEVIETTDTGSHFISTNTTVTASVAYTLSCYFKQSSGSRSAILRTNNVGTTTYAVFDFATETITETGADTRNATVEDVGNGWYRVSFTYTQDVTTLSGIIVSLSNSTTPSSSAPSYTGDGTSGIYIYGVQFEQAETPSSYVPTGSGSSVTRAAETFTIPSANLPWPSPVYIGSELVTNGTFDTDSDWTKGTGWTISGGKAVGSSAATLSQSASTISGNTYLFKFTVSNYSAGTITPNISGRSGPSFTGNGTFETAIVAAGGAAFNLLGGGNFTGDIDSVSIREINPLSVSIAMDGRITYADLNENVAGYFYQWREDSNNRVVQTLVTNSGTGAVSFQQVEGGIFDAKTTGGSLLSPDVLVPYNTAGRHGSTFVNGAVDGVALTADTTPTALADLSATDLNLVYDYMGTVGTFRVWDKDLGDTGLVEATAPSFEPSLSLEFTAEADTSFVVNDWSE